MRADGPFSFTTTRPVAVWMVFLAALVFGGFSARLLPLGLMPDITYPKLTVRTEYPGAAPSEVEANVSRPLEETLGVVTGLVRVVSTSRAGWSDVVLEFGWETSMDEANQDVLEKLDLAKPLLPETAKTPLVLRYDPSLDPVMVLSLHGTGPRYEGAAGLRSLRRLAEREVVRLLEPIDGVAAVKVKGGLEEEIEVHLDERQLVRTGIGIATVVARLRAENVNIAGGSVEDGRTRYLVRTKNELSQLDDLRNLVIAHRTGRDLRLSDLAEVKLGHRERDVVTRIDGQEAVLLEVYKDADANLIDLAARVHDAVDRQLGPRLDKEYGARIATASDQSRFIGASLAEVRSTAVLGGVLAIVVLFVFLGEIKNTVVIGLAIPMSIVLTFAPLHLSDVSLNIMSLGGLALGSGMLVDNAIVVLESIHRCREEGDDVLRATVRGTSEVGSAVVASTLTSIAVFFPVVFVEGVGGQMFGDLGLSVSYSLLASLAVALAFVPTLAAQLDGERPDAGEERVRDGLRRVWRSWETARWLEVRWHRGLVRSDLWVVPIVYGLLRTVVTFGFEVLAKGVLSLFILLLALLGTILRTAFWVLRRLGAPFLYLLRSMRDAVERSYGWILEQALRQAWIVVGAAASALVGAALLVPQLGFELIPELHTGELVVEARLPVGTPLEETVRVLGGVEAELSRRLPEGTEVTTVVGVARDAQQDGDRGEHTGRLRISQGVRAREAVVAPLPEATASPPVDRVAQEEAITRVIREVAAKVPELDVELARPVLFSWKAPVEVEVRGFELRALAEATSRVATRLAGLQGLDDVRASIVPGHPELGIVYDRVALARLGLDLRTVAEQVRDEIQGIEASRVSRGDRKVPVRVRVEGLERAAVQRLLELVIYTTGGRPVPLSQVARIEVGRGPSEIRRIDQSRAGVVTANLTGETLGGASVAVERALAELDLPAGTEAHIVGQAAEWTASSRSLIYALLFSVFLVYVIMAAQFESLRYPLVILATVPLALGGVVVGLASTRTPVSIVVFLGAIMLVGIVVNNAIVLVDYYGQLRERGLDRRSALETAGRVRLRPILMTTTTTLLGLLPMAFASGDGAELRVPLARTVMWGLATSTALTLVVVPALVELMDRRRAGARVSRRTELDREVAEARPEQLISEEEELARRGSVHGVDEGMPSP